MRSGFCSVAGFLATAILPGTVLLAGNLIQNPGFETGDLTGWTLTAGSSQCSDFVVAGGPYSGQFAANFGDMCAGDFDTISQVIATIPLEIYQLSFWLQTNMGETQVFWDGVQLGDFALGNWGYQQLTYTVTAQSDTATLAFAGNDPPSWNQLDAVALIDTGVLDPPAPEPSAMSLVLAGLASGAVFMRRRGIAAARR